MKKNILIIAPHPDDELLGCYTQLKKGIVSKVIYMTCQRANPPMFNLSENIESDVGNIAEYFKFDWEILPFPDGLYEFFVYNKNYRKIILEKLRKSIANYKYILIPSLLDPHPTHVLTHLLVVEVTRNMKPTPIIRSYSVNADKSGVLLDREDYRNKLSLYKKFYFVQYKIMKILGMEVSRYEEFSTRN